MRRYEYDSRGATLAEKNRVLLGKRLGAVLCRAGERRGCVAGHISCIELLLSLSPTRPRYVTEFRVAERVTPRNSATAGGAAFGERPEEKGKS